jgi:hypothetical protein
MEVHDNEPILGGDHSHEFICEDCKDNVSKFGDHDGLAVCQVCRYIRTVPDMPEDIKRLLRGHPDTSDIPEADEEWFKKAKRRDP